VVVAYSRNLLSAMSRVVKVELSLNGKQLGSMEEHYQLVSETTIRSICPDNSMGENSTQPHSQDHHCLLRLQLEGSAEGPTDLWLTAALTSQGIPLFSGVVLPFTTLNLEKGKPLRFYYEVASEQAVTLVISSLTYDSYTVRYAWVSEEEYMAADSDAQIYPPSNGSSFSSYRLTEVHRTLIDRLTPKANCENCILLLAVYPEQAVLNCELELQILGPEVSLGVGETRKGSLGATETITFLLPSSEQPTMVTLSGHSQQSCYSAQMTTSDDKERVVSTSRIQGAQVEIAAGSHSEIELLAESEGRGGRTCAFEVSRWGSDQPIRDLKPEHIYSVSLSGKATTYFLYYH
jgi:hypothetical protein